MITFDNLRLSILQIMIREVTSMQTGFVVHKLVIQ